MTDSTKPFYEEILECYRQHGAFSEKCQPIVDRMDANFSKSMKTSSDYSKLDVQGEVLSTLRRPVYPFHKKGRYRTLRPRQRDIYDGIF